MTLRLVVACLLSVLCCRIGDLLYQRPGWLSVVGGTGAYVALGLFWLLALRSGSYARALVVWEVCCLLSEFPALILARAHLSALQWAGLALTGIGAGLFSLAGEG